MSAPALVFLGRADAFEPRRTWSLGERELCIEFEDGRVDTLFEHGEIAELRLRHAGTRLQPNRWACRVRARDGREREFVSQAWLGPGRFEDRAESYASFVRELCLRVEASGGGARFVAGLPRTLLGIELGAFAVGTLAALLSPGLLGLDFRADPWLWFAWPLVCFALAVWHVRRRRARPIDPGRIPPGLLPPTQARPQP